MGTPTTLAVGTADATPSRFGPWRREVRAFLELLALTGITVAQPALDLLTKNSGLFVQLHTSELQAVAVAVLIVVVPPLVLWGVEVAAGLLLPSARRYVHALLAAAVITVFAIEVLKKQTSLYSSRLVVVAVPLGLIGGALILRFDVVRVFLRYLSIAPAVFALLFLFSSPVTAVVFENNSGAVAKVKVGSPERVVMITFDELALDSLLDGNGHVDADLFPNFAALAGDSTWYRNETTVAPYTSAAVPAILTGDFPTDEHATPIYAEHPHNLFTLLGGTYRMNVHESITHLCPSGVCAETAAGNASSNRFRELLDSTYDLWTDFASPRRESAVSLNAFQDPLQTGAAFVRSLRKTPGPELDFLHLMLPHQPWHLRGTGQDDQARQEVTGLSPKLYWVSDWAALSGRQRHLLQAQAADRLLGQVVDKLKRIGEYDRSLIVVTADHGVAFTGGHSIRGVASENYPQILWTPLFVRSPGQTAPAIDDRPVRSVDVLPTIADLLDTKLPWKVDGHSALTPSKQPDEPRVFHWLFSELVPPPGVKYSTPPGPAGFASVLKGQASADRGPADLRLYRIGPFGGLIGQPASPLTDSSESGPTAELKGSRRFEGVDPESPSIPWAWVEGTVELPAGIPLVVTVNGVIAGVSQTALEDATAGRSQFWSTLPPQLFQPGTDTIGVYVVKGTPERPRLVKVRLS